ncbi:MAG: nitroreductase family protein [Cytophagales bacterium]|nr:nitroreductase family protein [Cytophagales bacterium]
MQTKTSTDFSTIVKARRSVRVYDQNHAFDHSSVERALKLAILAPNSSNMQLWEFHRIKTEEKRKELARCCLGQSAARTASEMVVFVTRHDKWKKRAAFNLDLVKKAYDNAPNEKKARQAVSYYQKLIPMFYRRDWTGLSFLLKKLAVFLIGIKKPMIREVSAAHQKVVMHKSAALAAMTFMYAMKAEGYDTCPMEGFDSKRIKKMLKLPKGTEINMVVSCGKGLPEGIYSERVRLPFEEVVKEEK